MVKKVRFIFKVLWYTKFQHGATC